MTRRLRREDIYDAALDEAMFDALPALLAAAVGARSGVLHWHADRQPQLGELRHSHYFDDRQLAILDEEFPHDDIWSEAVRRAPNRAWRCDDLIGTDAYAASRIYNEWVVSMGDDSFHCLGASLASDGLTIEFGFHRARSQGSFTDAAVARLQSWLRPLAQTMAMRARLMTTEERAATLAAALDSGGDAIFVLDERGRPVHANRAAERLMERGESVTVRDGVLHGRLDADDRLLHAALRAASVPGAPVGGAVTLGRETGPGHPVSLLPTTVGGRRRIVAVVTAPDRDADRAPQLAALHGLSAAEAAIAIMLADGYVTAAIAERRGTSIATVRSQIKAILAKLAGSRQADIVAAVHALPRIGGVFS